MFLNVYSHAKNGVEHRKIVLKKPSQATSFIRKITNSSNQPGKFVKVLRLSRLFGKKEENWNPADAFSIIAQLCPNIEVLTSCATPASLWNLLIQAFKNGYWQQMKEIPMSFSEETLDMYFITTLSYSSTLKKVFLQDRLYFSWFHEYRTVNYKFFSTRLQNFSSLTFLCIMFPTTKTVFVLESLISNCLLLTYVQFTPIPEDTNNGDNDNPIITDLTLVASRTSIKEFYGKGVKFTTADSVQYFIHKFPNLEKLTLHPFRDDDDLLWDLLIFDLPVEAYTLFASYLSIIESVDVYSYLSTISMVDAIGGFFNARRVNARVQFKYENDDDYGYHFYPFLSISRKSTNNNIKSVARAEILLKANFRSNRDNPRLPHTTIVEQLGNDLKELKIDLGRKFFETYNSTGIEDNLQLSMGRSLEQLI